MIREVSRKETFRQGAKFLRGYTTPAPGFRKIEPVQPDDGPDWYLKEWLTFFGKKQASLVNELGWLKGRANKFWHGKHPYRRDVVNQIAGWLEIEPYELLMPPDQAIRLRRLRETAYAIAAEAGASFQPDSAAKPSGRLRHGAG